MISGAATNSVTLLDGTTAYAVDVEDKVNPLYTDIDNSNIAADADIAQSKLARNYPTQSSAVSFNVGTNAVFCFVDTTGGAVTATIPTALIVAGRPFHFIDVGGRAGTNYITIQGQGGETIEGVVSVQIVEDWGAMSIVPYTTSAMAIF